MKYIQRISSWFLSLSFSLVLPFIWKADDNVDIDEMSPSLCSNNASFINALCVTTKLETCFPLTDAHLNTVSIRFDFFVFVLVFNWIYRMTTFHLNNTEEKKKDFFVCRSSNFIQIFLFLWILIALYHFFPFFLLNFKTLYNETILSKWIQRASRILCFINCCVTNIW